MRPLDFNQLAETLEPQSKLLRAWPLNGGVSAQVTALELERPDGQTKKMIVRRHGELDRKQNPHIATDEFMLLQLLQTAEVAAPKPYHLDLSGQIFPTPYLVIEYIEGEPDFAPANLSHLILQLATHLVKIHQVDGSDPNLSFLPKPIKGFGERPVTLDQSLNEGLIRERLESLWPLPQRNKSVLLHGDFWPGNILWQEGRLVAVIDWEDAKVGDPLFDVANSRLEILWAFGAEAMHKFTHHYQAMTTVDVTNLPYWDLCAALRPASKLSEWGLDAATEKRMRVGHKWFITQAFEKLSESQ